MKMFQEFKIAVALAVTGIGTTALPVAAPAFAQANPPYPLPNDSNRGPFRDQTDSDPAYIAEIADEEKIDRGMAYAYERYDDLARSEGNRGRYRSQLTNPYNSSSLSNRLYRRIDPANIGGGVGRVLGRCGLSAGTAIRAEQSRDFNDNVVRSWVLDGVDADQAARHPREGDDPSRKTLDEETARANFLRIGERLFLHDYHAEVMGRNAATRCARGLGQDFFRNRRSPLEGLLRRIP